MRGCLFIMKGCLENGLYVLQGSTVIGSVAVVRIMEIRITCYGIRGLDMLVKEGCKS